MSRSASMIQKMNPLTRLRQWERNRQRYNTTKRFEVNDCNSEFVKQIGNSSLSQLSREGKLNGKIRLRGRPEPLPGVQQLPATGLPSLRSHEDRPRCRVRFSQGRADSGLQRPGRLRSVCPEEARVGPAGAEQEGGRRYSPRGLRGQLHQGRHEDNRRIHDGPAGIGAAYHVLLVALRSEL